MELAQFGFYVRKNQNFLTFLDITIKTPNIYDDYPLYAAWNI